MSEERKTKTDAAAPASAALGRIDRKDAFLQALHTFLTAHQGTEWAVAAVDIQHFKLYNELYGTEKGDALLETVANCLLGYSRQTGYPVGYFGNDDFFLCLPDEKAEQTAVLATLQACMAAGRQDVTFFMVMGVCPVQANPGADAATLCNYAQIAGVTTDSGYLHRFEPTMLNELKEQQQLLGELERALDNHEFCFFLQPKCNSMTRAIVGMEALVRWNHPTRGCVPPAEFMPLLERTGLVTRLDQYIWESVCQTLQKWQESGSNLVPVSVNVSVQDILNLDVPQIFADLVEKYKLEPKLLLAEITETMVAEDTQMVESAIQACTARLLGDDGRLRQRVFLAEYAQGYQRRCHQAGHEAHRHESGEPQQGRADRGVGGGYGTPAEPAHHRRGCGDPGAGVHAASRRLPVFAGLLLLQAHAGGKRRKTAGRSHQSGLLGSAPRPDAPRPPGGEPGHRKRPRRPCRPTRSLPTTCWRSRC